MIVDTDSYEASRLLLRKRTPSCRGNSNQVWRPCAAAIRHNPAAKRRNEKARHGSAGNASEERRESRRDGTDGAQVSKHSHPLVFSTKNRCDLIPDELRSRLWRYLAGIGRNHKIPVLVAGGTANHIHVLVALPADVTVAKVIQILKANSSRWMGEHGIGFAWQEGYGAFSVSASHLPVVRDYIEHQQQHHARRSYEDEFLALLRKTGVGFEPEQVFG